MINENLLGRILESSSQVKPAYGFYSARNETQQYCESDNEYYACLQREYDDSIEKYVTQPETMWFKKDGKLIRYTSDCLIHYHDKTVAYVEDKTLEETLTEEFQEKFAFLTQAFEQVIKQPLVLNAIDRKSLGKSIANMELLYAYRRMAFDADMLSLLLPTLPDTTLTCSELVSACKRLDLAPEFAWIAIAHGQFNYSNESLLTTNSMVEVANA